MGFLFSPEEAASPGMSLPIFKEVFMKQTQSMPAIATRTLAYCALLAALSVVLARLIIPMPNESTRFSIEAVPIFISGMLFGPLAGGLVGFCADFVGTLFSGYGFNPLFCVPPILYGVCGGLFRHYIAKNVSLPRLFVGMIPPVVVGSILYQSVTLAYIYPTGTFLQSLILKLTTRSIQFSITLVLDVVVIFLLFRSRIFNRIGVWPPRNQQSK
jgi:ECF transporter S component (folate family)